LLRDGTADTRRSAQPVRKTPACKRHIALTLGTDAHMVLTQ
jgi:hypothetical protein